MEIYLQAVELQDVRGNNPLLSSDLEMRGMNSKTGSRSWQTLRSGYKEYLCEV